MLGFSGGESGRGASRQCQVLICQVLKAIPRAAAPWTAVSEPITHTIFSSKLCGQLGGDVGGGDDEVGGCMYRQTSNGRKMFSTPWT